MIKRTYLILMIAAILLAACGQSESTGSPPPSATPATTTGMEPSPVDDETPVSESGESPTPTAASLLATPQPIAASILATQLVNTVVSGQQGRIGQVRGLLINTASGQDGYLVARTLGQETVRTVLLPAGTYQVAILPPGGDGQRSLLPVVWLLVSDEDFMQAPEINPDSFSDPAYFAAGWEQPVLAYWADRVDLPAGGDSPAAEVLAEGQWMYLRGSLLEEFNLPVYDGQGNAIGEIVDLVVEPGGAVGFGLLQPSAETESAVETVIIPFRELHWNVEQQRFTTPAAAELLRSAPAFDRAELPDMTIPGWDQPWRDHWAAPESASQATPAARQGITLQVSRLIGRTVVDVNEAALGSVEDLVLNDAGGVLYLVVSVAGQFRPVPWEDFSFNLTADQITYIDDTARLQEAPGFDALAEIDLTDPLWDEKIRAHWGLAR